MILSDGGLPSTGAKASAALAKLDTAYPAMETLARQYAEPVGHRVALSVHLNGPACYAGGAEALLAQQQRPSLSPTASLSHVAAATHDAAALPDQGNADAAALAEPNAADASSDPFSFLNQQSAPSPPSSSGDTAHQGKPPGAGLRGFFSKVAQTTTQRLERGMTHLAIKADRGKSTDRLLVALVDVTPQNQRPFVVGLTEARAVPADEIARNAQGLRFAIPLYVPGAAPPTARLQCHVYLKPGAAALWNSKPLLVGTTQVWSVQQLREAAQPSLPQQAQAPPQAPPTQWTLTLQSSLVVDGKLTCAVLPDPKFPLLGGPGWSLADPTHAQGTNYPTHVFDYPLDQSYALPLTLPTSHVTLDATAQGPAAPPPPATSALLATERTTESTVVLPLATAWWRSLVQPALQVSRQHALAVAARIAHQRQDTPDPSKAVETHVTIHQLTLSAVGDDTLGGKAAPSQSSHHHHRRVSVHCQRPDSIFEVEWGTGNVIAMDAQTTPAGTPLPPPATVMGYPKPVALTDVLPSLQQLQQQPPPPHGYRLGTLRFQMDGNATVSCEAFLDLDAVLGQATTASGTPLSYQLPVVMAHSPSTVVGHLHVTVRMTLPTTTPGDTSSSSLAALPPWVSPAGGLVALVGMTTALPLVRPALDALNTPHNAADESTARRSGQLATMGYFYTKDYLDFHLQQVRSKDEQEMEEKSQAYSSALTQSAVTTNTTTRPPAHQDRSPRAFRPSSSRSETVLSGLPFNCHTATLQLSLLTQSEKRDVAYFYNVTCGAPADHARDFGSVFRKDVDLQGLGLVSPVGPITGGLRRLEAKRLELIKVVDDLQTMLIMQVANYFVTERSHRKVVHHVPARDAELQSMRWKLFEAVQSLHHVTWTCAVRRASVFSQALGLAVTCFLASLSDMAKYKSTWPDLWAKHGFLLCFEGLLSAAGKELGMIEDASVGIEMLKHVQIVLVPDAEGAAATSAAAQGRCPVPHSPYLKWVQITTENQSTDGPTEYLVQLAMVPSYYEQRVPANFKHGTKIRLYPLLFEVGVDIRQWGAHAASNASKNYRRGDSGEDLGGKEAGSVAAAAAAPQGLLDDEDDDVGISDDDVLVQLNFEAFQKLNTYAFRVSPANSNSSSQKVHPLLETLHQHILSSSGKINHDILDEAATLSQQLGGGAVVFCKSGKDRTAMHVTYKQSQFANRYKRHWSPNATPEVILETCLEDAAIIRTHGTRLPICEKNVGQAKFAFNSLQVKFMPDKLKPPMNTLAGFLKGGKVFTGGGIES